MYDNDVDLNAIKELAVKRTTSMSKEERETSGRFFSFVDTGRSSVLRSASSLQTSAGTPTRSGESQSPPRAGEGIELVERRPQDASSGGESKGTSDAAAVDVDEVPFSQEQRVHPQSRPKHAKLSRDKKRRLSRLLHMDVDHAAFNESTSMGVWSALGAKEGLRKGDSFMKNSGSSKPSTESALSFKASKKFAMDYNIMESIFLFCSILVLLSALIFVSSKTGSAAGVLRISTAIRGNASSTSNVEEIAITGLEYVVVVLVIGVVTFSSIYFGCVFLLELYRSCAWYRNVQKRKREQKQQHESNAGDDEHDATISADVTIVDQERGDSTDLSWFDNPQIQSVAEGASGGEGSSNPTGNGGGLVSRRGEGKHHALSSFNSSRGAGNPAMRNRVSGAGKSSDQQRAGEQRKKQMSEGGGNALKVLKKTTSANVDPVVTSSVDKESRLKRTWSLNPAEGLDPNAGKVGSGGSGGQQAV